MICGALRVQDYPVPRSPFAIQLFEQLGRRHSEGSLRRAVGRSPSSEDEATNPHVPEVQAPRSQRPVLPTGGAFCGVGDTENEEGVTAGERVCWGRRDAVSLEERCRGIGVRPERGRERWQLRDLGAQTSS